MLVRLELVNTRIIAGSQSIVASATATATTSCSVLQGVDDEDPTVQSTGGESKKACRIGVDVTQGGSAAANAYAGGENSTFVCGSGYSLLNLGLTDSIGGGSVLYRLESDYQPSTIVKALYDVELPATMTMSLGIGNGNGDIYQQKFYRVLDEKCNVLPCATIVDSREVKTSVSPVVRISGQGLSPVDGVDPEDAAVALAIFVDGVNTYDGSTSSQEFDAIFAGGDGTGNFNDYDTDFFRNYSFFCPAEGGGSFSNPGTGTSGTLSTIQALRGSSVFAYIKTLRRDDGTVLSWWHNPSGTESGLIPLDTPTLIFFPTFGSSSAAVSFELNASTVEVTNNVISCVLSFGQVNLDLTDTIPANNTVTPPQAAVPQITWLDRRVMASAPLVSVGQPGFRADLDFFQDSVIDLKDYQQFDSCWRSYVSCRADIAGANQSTIPDGYLNADDIIVFLGRYFNGDRVVDVASANQGDGPDGALGADDIIKYLGWYFADCP